MCAEGERGIGGGGGLCVLVCVSSWAAPNGLVAAAVCFPLKPDINLLAPNV